MACCPPVRRIKSRKSVKMCSEMSALSRSRFESLSPIHRVAVYAQCDQQKVAKCLQKLLKNDCTKKLNILKHLQKLAKNVGDLGKRIVATGFAKLPKVQKSPNLVTLYYAETFFRMFRLNGRSARSRKILENGFFNWVIPGSLFLYFRLFYSS